MLTSSNALLEWRESTMPYMIFPALNTAQWRAGAATLVTRSTVKHEWKAAWAPRAITSRISRRGVVHDEDT